MTYIVSIGDIKQMSHHYYIILSFSLQVEVVEIFAFCQLHCKKVFLLYSLAFKGVVCLFF